MQKAIAAAIEDAPARIQHDPADLVSIEACDLDFDLMVEADATARRQRGDTIGVQPSGQILGQDPLEGGLQRFRPLIELGNVHSVGAAPRHDLRPIEISRQVDRPDAEPHRFFDRCLTCRCSI